MSAFHSFSSWLENILSRHQYMINMTAAVSAVAMLIIAVKIWLLVKQQTSLRQQANQISGIGLFLGERGTLTDRLGYLCFCALLGRRPSMDSLATPQSGLSLLLESLQDSDNGALKSHPQATQFRSKAAIVRSSELQDLVLEMQQVITLADDCGCLAMVDRRITDLYTESKKGVLSIRGPGPQPH